jgi:parallel beta-helix repeat protein
MKTLVEVEPRVAVQSLPGNETALYVISDPGSYYLTGNITGVEGKHGIEVASDAVSIDLNGFSLIGSPDAVSAVAVPEEHHSLAVKNGSIIAWPVAIGGKGTAHASLMSNLIIKSLGGGMTVGTKSIVSECSIDTAGTALVVGEGSIVQNCTITSGESVGIWVGQDVRILDCLINACGNDGIRAGSRCVIRGCSVSNNRRAGIRVSGDRAVVIGNSCNDNGQGLVGHGIFVDGGGSRVEGNYCAGNDIGIQASGVVIRNIASGNGTNYTITGGVVSNNPATAGPWANLEN